MRRCAPQAVLVLIFLASCLRLHAQPDTYTQSILDVCNKGTVSVEVVVASKNEDIARGGLFGAISGNGKYYWEIEGTSVAPRECKTVNTNAGVPAYIAFGFADTKGVWGSGKIAQVPDLGKVGRPTASNLFHEDQVLIASPSAKEMCVHKDETQYVMNDDFQTNCSTLKLTGGIRPDIGHGGFFPVTAVFYYYPESYRCPDDPNPSVPYACENTHYYLNVTPGGGDRELHATVGTSGGGEDKPVDPAQAIQALRSILDNLQAQQNPACNVITKAEAEAVLGVPIDGPQPGRTLCRYQEPGYGTDPSKHKQITIGIWRSTTAAAEDVNNRRNAIIKDKSLLPVTYKELPDFGDAAFWVWAGGYYGALYAFRGGMVEVAVKISGVPESVALANAKKFAARPLGGTGKTGYLYAVRKDQ
jgi:hypothetical protein